MPLRRRMISTKRKSLMQHRVSPNKVMVVQLNLMLMIKMLKKLPLLNPRKRMTVMIPVKAKMKMIMIRRKKNK